MTNDQIIALFASLGACFSAVATFLTVRQIAKQREASYRPELAFSRVFIECTKDPHSHGTIPTHWIAKDKDNKDIKQSRMFSLPLLNIGLGTAKSISVNWMFPFEDLTKRVNELAQKTLSAAYFKFDNGMLSIDSEKYGKSTSMWRNQKQRTLDYVLPASVAKDPTMLELPHAYIMIVSFFIFFSAKDSSKDKIHFSVPEIPPLMLEVQYSDIGETRHKAPFAIQFQLIVIGSCGEFISGYLEPKKNA